MVNIFGDRGKGNRGLRGVPGPIGPSGPRGAKGRKGDAGVSGIDDMCRWLPKLVLDQFQQAEVCCFTLVEPHKDLIVGKGGVYKAWLSHSKAKLNAVAMYPSKHILHISTIHNALVFDHSLYKVDGAVISPLPYTSKRNYTCACITFQVDGENDQFLFADWQDWSTTFRGVSASSKEIRIWGVKNNKLPYLSIPHETKRSEWTTLLVECSNINDNRDA